MNDIKNWLKLTTTKNIGRAKAKKLIDLFGKPMNFLGDNACVLKDVDFLSSSIKNELANDTYNFDWQKISDLILKYGIKFISILDDNYPKLLNNIYAPPLFLFYRGNWNIDIFRKCIAIVGTRKASAYGQIMTKNIGSELARSGFTIVSGLAYGIDTLAHFSAVENNMPTIAVMGTGCDQIYPGRNQGLADKILEDGLLISEYIPGSKPEKWNFPNRNRLISGLSLGTFVIEGSKKSGALLTSKFALEQNRDVFALPGDINREESKGPNYLIKLGAKIVTCSQDILEEYDLVPVIKDKVFPKLNKEENFIYNLILDNKPEIHFDDLFVKSKLSIGELSMMLLSLELKSVIKNIPGNKIVAMY